MQVDLVLDGKKYSFNLDEELKISEDNLNGEVKNHPRSHAFLLMLHKRLLIKVQDSRRSLRKLHDNLLSEASKTYDKVTVAKAHIQSDKKLLFKEAEIARMEEIPDYIGVAVESFRIRKDF